MIKSRGYAAKSATSNFAPIDFNRRNIQDDDVLIDISFCGVCHSDLHTARSQWSDFSQTIYPVIPGHEIVGKVAKVGAGVKKFKVGDTVGVGCLVDSCSSCDHCKNDLEQYCENGFNPTYNGTDKVIGGQTFGGYSKNIVVKEHFVLNIPENLDLAASAPLLCAGITTYSPLRHWNIQKGDKVGVIGLGGLGHMAVKLANAMGADVSVFSRTSAKEKDAKRLGAKEIIISTNKEQMQHHAGSFKFILDTVGSTHDLDPYISLLKVDGTIVMLGVPEHRHPSPNIANLTFGRRAIAGSLIGGLKETQEMLNFCSEHNITSDIELININYIDKAYDRMLNSDVRYRFVIDMSSL